MQVETYEVEPVEQSEMQALAAEGETSMLIESLGLEGQKTLVNKDNGTFIPYRIITREEHFVFRTLFPNKTDVKNYKDGTIPLRVLQIIAHCKILDMPDLSYLEVWHPNAGIDDPVLVGRKGSYYDPVYLLARWGKALLPFDELRTQALKLAANKCRIDLRKIAQEVETALKNVDDIVMEKLIKGLMGEPSFSI